MIKSQLNTSVQSNIEFSSLPKEQTIKAILQFLQVYLPLFSQSFLAEGLFIHKEDDILRKLSPFLQNKIENLIIQFDAKEGSDFIIYIKPYFLSAKPIFLLEAKRLEQDKRDYVAGKTGGIERFKREQKGYGKDLTTSAMLGYIQQFSKEYWFEKVNAWIAEMIKEKVELSWNENDKLVGEKEFSDFISKHDRITQPPITLYHFWLILYKQQA